MFVSFIILLNNYRYRSKYLEYNAFNEAGQQITILCIDDIVVVLSVFVYRRI